MLGKKTKITFFIFFQNVALVRYFKDFGFLVM